MNWRILIRAESTLSSLDSVWLFLDNIFSFLVELATDLLSAGEGLVIMLAGRFDDSEAFIDCEIFHPDMGTIYFQSSAVLIES